MILSLRGWRYVKFFPAEVSGGRAALKALGPVFPHMRFCPTGGITAENAADYLALDNVAFVGGSWITPTEAVRSGNWAEIERRAEGADQIASARRTGASAC
jgi:2-dehydro-3-deoxyphosphogluconate aldolase / (4S)-4-hydroxy-2-oxoglutarate aldolase